MELGVTLGGCDVETLAVARQLGDGLLARRVHLGVGGRRGQILQLQQIAVRQLGIDFEARLHLDAGVAARYLLPAPALRARILLADGKE